MPPMRMVKGFDAAKDIWQRLGSLDGFEVMHNDVLIAVFVRPSEIAVKGGKKLHIPDQTIKEDEYQGKAGLVIMKGPQAFVSDENYDFKGQDVHIGDWVSIWVSDGRKVTINGVLCRMVEDRHIRMKIPSPDAVY